MMRSRADITECFICGYSLVGHPVECRCPECGTAYDDSTVVFVARVSSLLTGSAPLDALGILILWVAVGRLFPGSSDALLVMCIGIVGYLSWRCLRWRALRRDPKTPKVALGLAGIVASEGGAGGTPEVVAWAEVRRMSEPRTRGWVATEILVQLGVELSENDAAEFEKELDQRILTARKTGRAAS